VDGYDVEINTLNEKIKSLTGEKDKFQEESKLKSKELEKFAKQDEEQKGYDAKKKKLILNLFSAFESIAKRVCSI
jgi:predicted nuclease with TOPRIM domain